MNYLVFLISGPRNNVQFEQFTILLRRQEIKDFALHTHGQNVKWICYVGCKDDLGQVYVGWIGLHSFRATSGPTKKSTVKITRNPRCTTTRLLTNSFVQAPNPFPFHSFYEAIQQSFVNGPINRLGLETNFQRVEGMAHQAHGNATECSRYYIFQSSPDK